MAAYTYYSKIESSEHMLFAREIAMNFGILNAKGNYYSALVGIVIKDYIKQNNIIYEPLYFNTSKGLVKVYPLGMWYPAMVRMCVLSSEDNIYISNSGKKYKFKKLIGGIVK